MDKPKYIAEGFEEDVSKLLNEFVEECSVEFSDFARIWRNNHFSLIFMGRPDQSETSEFTNEVFRITSYFLSSPSFYQKIGAVYLLYALYRNQIADPPVKIRIEMSHWRVIKNLQQDAWMKYKSLHYVIDYLIKNAFLYVARQTLKGPLIGSMQNVSKNFEVISNMKNVYRADAIEYSAHNNLQALKDLHIQYLDVKKNLDGQAKVSLNTDSEVYQIFISDVNKLVNPPKMKNDESENLGSRRAKIKAESFIRKAKDRFGLPIDDDEGDEGRDDSGPSPRKRVPKKRVPKHRRRIGRPRKEPEPEEAKSDDDDDDDIDITHLLVQQNEFYLPPEEESTKVKNKAGRYYYRLSPKREDNASNYTED